jgi:hypothetical protein
MTTHRRREGATRRRWARRCLCLIAACLLLGGCDSKHDSGSTAGSEAMRDVQEAGDTDESPSELSRKRSAFGLPFPPRVATVRRFDDAVEVDTPMSIEELTEFFRARLVDYEILHPGDHGRSIRIVGLRPFMPSLEGNAHGSIVYLRYYPARKSPDPRSVDAGTSSSPEAPSPSSNDDEAAPAAPDRSELDLETIAPGAEPGEPYTPPPGSPLDKARYKSNFGQPIGEWHLP